MFNLKVKKLAYYIEQDYVLVLDIFRFEFLRKNLNLSLLGFKVLKFVLFIIEDI